MPVAQWRRAKHSAVAAGVAAGGALVPGLGLLAAAALGVHYAMQRARMRSPVTLAQWQAAVAEDGTLLHSFQALVEHIAEKGMEQEARAIAWPYLLELYTPEQTDADREAAYAYMRNAYISLLRTCQDLEASFVDATTMRHQPDAWPDGDDGPSTSALAAINSPAKVTSLGQLSRADVPQFLQQYWEAQRIIAVDAVRTDLKKHSIKGAGGAREEEGSGLAPAVDHGCASPPPAPAAAAQPCSWQPEAQRAVDSAAAPAASAAAPAAPGSATADGGGGDAGGGGITLGPSTREALANWFSSAKSSLREKVESSTLYKRYQQQQQAAQQQDQQPAQPLQQEQQQQAEAQPAAARGAAKAQRGGEDAASADAGEAARSAAEAATAPVGHGGGPGGGDATSVPGGALAGTAATPAATAAATAPAPAGQLRAAGQPEPQPSCLNRHVESGPEGCAAPPVSPSPSPSTAVADGPEAHTAAAGLIHGGAAAAGNSCHACPGGVAGGSSSLVWLSSLARFHLDNAAHFSPPQRRQVERLITLLSAYAIHDPEIGYCQGMSDLALPFLLLLEDDVVAFWCFAALMRKVRTGFVHHDQGIFGRLAALARLLEALDAPLGDKLRRLHADHCHFAYRMVMVVMRRELPLEQVLRLWEQLWADDLLQAADAAAVAAAAGQVNEGDAVLLPPASRPAAAAAASAAPSPDTHEADATCAAHDNAGGQAAAPPAVAAHGHGPCNKRPDPATPTRSDSTAAAAPSSSSSVWTMSRASSLVDRLSAWSAARTPAAVGASTAAATQQTARSGLWLSRRCAAGESSSRCSSEATARDLQLGAASAGPEGDAEGDVAATDPRPVPQQGTHMRHGSCSSCAEEAVPALELEPALAVACGPAAPGVANAEAACTTPAAARVVADTACVAAAVGAGTNLASASDSVAPANGETAVGVVFAGGVRETAAAGDADDDNDVIIEQVAARSPDAGMPVPTAYGGGGAVQAVVQVPYVLPYGNELFQYVVAAVVLGQRRKILDECHEHDDVLRLFQVLPRIDVADYIKRAKEYRAKLAGGSGKLAGTGAVLLR